MRDSAIRAYRRWTFCLAALATAVAFAPPARGQALSAGDVKLVLGTAAIPADKEAPLRTYFNGYFAKFVAGCKANDGARLRRDLRTYFTAIPRGQNAARDWLNNLTFTFLRGRVTESRESFAVRYHAMLVIGELNSSDTAPYAPATGLLVTAVSNAKVPAGLRVAGLIGLQRHVETGQLDAAAKSKVAALAKLVGSPAPATFAPAAWESFEMAVAQCVAQLNDAALTPQLAPRLHAVVAARAAPDTVRFGAAKTLGELNFSGHIALPYNAYADAAAGMVKQIAEAEIDAAERGAVFSRRRVRQAMQSALAAFGSGRKGLSGAPIPQAQKKTVDELRKTLIDVARVLEDREVADNEVPGKIKDLIGSLPPLPAAETAEPAADATATVGAVR